MSRDPSKPPRLGLGMLAKAMIACVLIVLATAGAVSATVLLQVDDLINIVENEREGRVEINIPEITPAEAGKPQTLMILGSDQRYGDRKAGLKPRSDTIILVRLDAHQQATSVMSIPRDLLVDIPGYGGPQKINGAYTLGGPRLTLKTVKGLLSTPERPFKINHVVTISFEAFQRAINYVGGVYVDIDHRYYNDNTQGGEHYATIDVPAGYQKLHGEDALDYVRYRHTDNDLVRAARQQDFLRQIRNQSGTKKLMSPSLSNLRRLAKLFARYFDYDKGLAKKKQIFSLAKLVLGTATHPVRRGAVRGRRRARPRQPRGVAEHAAAQRRPLPGADEGLLVVVGLEEVERRVVQEAQQERHRLQERARPRRRAHRGREPGDPGRPQDGFPFYFPALRDAGGSYVGENQGPRMYTIRDELNRRSPRLPARARDRPAGELLRHPGHDLEDARRSSTTRTARAAVDGRKLLIYYDGSRAAPGRLEDVARPSTGSRTRSPARSTSARCSPSPPRCGAWLIVARPLVLSAAHEYRARTDRRHRHRLRRPRHGRRLRRARLRGLLRRHRRGEDRAACKQRRDPDLGARASRSSSRSNRERMHFSTDARRRARARAAAVRRGRHAADLLG